MITLFNSGAEKLTGYDATDVVGKESPALFHLPEEIAIRSAEISLAHGRPVEGFRIFTYFADRENSETREWTFVRRDGTSLPVSLTVTSQTDKNGEIIGYLGIAIDITERQESHQKLRMSEQRFRDTAQQLTLATQAAHLGVWDLNLLSGQLEWNKEMFRIYGVTEQDFRDPMEIWANAQLPEDVKKATTDFEHGIAHPNTPYVSEFSIQRADGQIRHLRAMGQAISGAQGRAERVIGINEDITERKQAELALLEEAQHTQSIIDNIFDAIITIDSSGLMHAFNPAANLIFGYTEQEVLGENVSMLISSPHSESHECSLQNYKNTWVKSAIGVNREIEGKRKDGSVFAMELTSSEIIRTGQTMYVCMFRDISERKRMERIKNEFISTVSHELRTPLTSISGALGLIDGGGLCELSKQAQEMISIACKNSQRLIDLVNDLLDMDKIASGKLAFKIESLSLMPMIELALQSHRTYVANQKVKLILYSTTAETKVLVDSQRLQQVLANLLSNAIKFSAVGGIVRVSVHPKPDLVRVKVTDQGPGISEEFRDHIFEKFSQADSSNTRQNGGSGLGLAISRDLVEGMGGHIGFDSVKGEGASFWIELPLSEQGQIISVSDSPVAQRNAPWILLLQDGSHSTKELASLLTCNGYQVDNVRTGKQALSALGNHVYEAVILDLVLPDINGLEIIRQLRQQAHMVSLPIMIVSTKMREGLLAINGELSGIEWLAKPFEKRQLLHTIDVLLETTATPGSRILYVKDDGELHQAIQIILGDRFSIELSTSLGEAYKRIKEERFDMVILDVGFPDGSDWELLSEISAHQQVLILFGTNEVSEEFHKDKTVLFKSQASPRELLNTLNNRIQHQNEGNEHA